MDQPDLKTRRLFLRSFSIKDAINVQRMAGNINVAKMTLHVPHPYENGMAENWIKSHKEHVESGTQLSYAITLLDSGLLVGAIGLTKIEPTQASMGYWVGEEYWGSGYCPEAGDALIQYAFESLLLERVYAQHLTSNPASGRVMQKMGMEHYGTEIMQDRFGKPASMELYDIKKSTAGMT